MIFLRLSNTAQSVCARQSHGLTSAVASAGARRVNFTPPPPPSPLSVHPHSEVIGFPASCLSPQLFMPSPLSSPQSPVPCDPHARPPLYPKPPGPGLPASSPSPSPSPPCAHPCRTKRDSTQRCRAIMFAMVQPSLTLALSHFYMYVRVVIAHMSHLDACMT